jgi:hypothetical protein
VGDAGSVFEGNLWAINIYNRPMGFYSAMALMQNPLCMYAPEPSNGQAFEALPPVEEPPGGSDPGAGDDGGGLLGESDICSQLA